MVHNGFFIYASFLAVALEDAVDRSPVRRFDKVNNMARLIYRRTVLRLSFSLHACLYICRYIATREIAKEPQYNDIY
jgi:hypothetical protein